MSAGTITHRELLRDLKEDNGNQPIVIARDHDTKKDHTRVGQTLISVLYLDVERRFPENTLFRHTCLKSWMSEKV